MTSPVITLIVSREPLLCLGLRSFLQINLGVDHCHQTSTLSEALAIQAEHSPGLIIVAACIAGEDTPRIVRELSKGRVPTSLVVVGNQPQSDFVRRIFFAGAHAFVTGLDSLEEVNQAIQSALRGSLYVCPQATDGMRLALTGNEATTSENQLSALSDREMEVFELMGRGLSGKEIAMHLFISVKTVETHKHRIKEKLHFPHATQLVRAAANHSLRASSSKKQTNDLLA